MTARPAPRSAPNAAPGPARPAALRLMLCTLVAALGALAACGSSQAATRSDAYAGSPGAPSPYQEQARSRAVRESAPARAPGGAPGDMPAEMEADEGGGSPLAALHGAGADGEDSGPDREGYNTLIDNPFIRVDDDPLSTFSIDIDTASYANVRRMLLAGYRPPPSAVRVEEMINYFAYDYPAPSGDHPFHVDVEVASAPWAPEHRLLRVGLKGETIDWSKRPRSNLVFLLDVSGSMADPNKLPLLQQSLALLVDNLDENDRVSIVVYAGASGLVLPPTSGEDRRTILAALENLEAGGSTNGGEGIELAYQVAAESFIRGGSNRVILATDGDFNVGVTSQGELVRLIEQKAKSGIFLSVLGLGMGNYQDGALEELSNRGNGNYAYIDTLQEAKKVLVEQMGGTLVTIAKDVKIQIEFNPLHVGAYRLIGYENRVLEHQDFNDDKKDAGDIGAGHTVTALYEIVPTAKVAGGAKVDALKYQSGRELSPSADSDEIATVKLRYKQPDGHTSQLLSVAAVDDRRSAQEATADFRFAAAVAGFGMLLRESPHKGTITFDQVAELASSDERLAQDAYRAEFLDLVSRASRL